MAPIITSILDTDLYKLSMMQAILFGYPAVDVEYEFINRGKHAFPVDRSEHPNFPLDFQDELRDQVRCLSGLALTNDERVFLKGACPYLKRAYLDFLAGYRFDPKEVQINQEGERLSVKICGPWYRTVLWEVPLMAIISELFYKIKGMESPGTEAVRQIAAKKAKRLGDAGCMFADFGTRRRFSRQVHRETVEMMKDVSTRAWKETLIGTSNVDLAYRFGLRPIGTHAHEWFMAIAAMYGYPNANANALKAWTKEYHGDLGIALTDTFTSKAFFPQFTKDFAKLFDGVRHDSGDPIEFAERAIAHYRSLDIQPLEKTIVFSDGLDVEKAIKIREWCRGKIKCSFGIGTHFTNDVGHTPLNIVIKMTRCNDLPTVKLSDVNGKHTGDKESINAVLRVLGLSKP